LITSGIAFEKKRISGSERGDDRKRRKMEGGGGRLDEKDENDRGKDGTERKKERMNNVIITGIVGIRGNIERGGGRMVRKEES
jgi:hypothetical protein